MITRDGDHWLRFGPPATCLRARSAEEVRPVLREAEQAVQAGHWVWGTVAYHAAGAWNPGLVARPDDGFWLALDVGDPPQVAEVPPAGPTVLPRWTGEWTFEEYRERFELLRAALAAGDLYQANLTYRLRAYVHDPWRLFLALVEPGPPAYATYWNDGERTVVSLSPELFWEREGSWIRCRPMKGTAPADAHPDLLVGSEKERAENLMIVDMVRNDLGRVARTGSVRVPHLFATERLPTVLQMTSTVEAEADVPSLDVWQALHPCASVTGAPKEMAVHRLDAWESSPRGLYCGAIGFAGPGRERWAVAIRTATVRPEGPARYGIGSGIVWDSTAEAEWAECARKAAVLEGTPWNLLETMPGDPATWDDHLDRLGRSAQELGVPFERGAIRRVLVPHAGAGRVRLTLSPVGVPRVTSAPLDSWPSSLRVAVEPNVLRSDDPWRRYKTTHREVYEAALARHPEADEVLLGNERGEAVEFCRGTLLARYGQGWTTPSVSDGALPGVARAQWLAEGRAQEVTIRLDDLPGRELAFLSSLRGFVPVRVLGS